MNPSWADIAAQGAFEIIDILHRKMENHVAIIEQTLIKELLEKGINDEIIPRFIKDLAYSYEIDPSFSLSEINDRLHYLGWNDVDLDYHTLQLAIASFEGDKSVLPV